MEEPLKPFTIFTPNLAAALAVSITSCAARWYAFGVPSPRSGWAVYFVALIDRVIAYALPDQVGADCEAFQVVFVQNVPAALDVFGVCQCLVDFEMVAPACQLKAVETMRSPSGDFFEEDLPIAL
jgi:hypothetical protein